MSYNGHKNWAQWNVSLWINNDEGLYNLARECVRMRRARILAAQDFKALLEDVGTTHTPDGARYTVTAIRHAMVGM